MCRGVRVAAQSRAMLPVFGGISGSTSATLIIKKYPLFFVRDQLFRFVSSNLCDDHKQLTIDD
jgi:hypothetical protein